ncbi:MAG: glycosyltransferase [Verrucomicrobiota bacterium]
MVTIGIPCHNADRWIMAAVQSALNQDWPATEILVVDDGSTDRTRSLIEGFGDQIRFITQENAGPNRARNEILKNARGEWIQYLDADDYLKQRKLSHQMAIVSRKTDIDLLLSPVLVEEWKANQPCPHQTTSYNPAYDDYQLWLSWQMPQTGGALWRRDTLEALGGWDEDLPCCQEHELYLRALTSQKIRGHFDPTPLAVYRIWSEGTVCRKNPLQLIETKTRLIRQLKAWMEARNLWEEKHRGIAGQACFEMARKLATIDLDHATSYFHERRSEGLIFKAGDAAPASYRSLLKVLGFGRTERIANALRTLQSS